MVSTPSLTFDLWREELISYSNRDTLLGVCRILLARQQQTNTCTCTCKAFYTYMYMYIHVSTCVYTAYIHTRLNLNCDCVREGKECSYKI